MKKSIFAVAAIAAMAGVPALAAGDLTRNNVQVVELKMGTHDDGTMFFEPDNLTFETGVAYELKMINVDPIKHEVTMGEAVEKMFTRKVEVENGDETVVEVKGQVHEVEIGPNQTVSWFFLPVQPIENAELACEIEGHKEAGMVGTVTFK